MEKTRLPTYGNPTMPLVDPITMSGMSTASQSRSPRPSTPIEVLPTAFAGNYFHPVVLLAAFYLRFPALVADPVPTLLWTLLPVAVAQTAYCVYCLPIAGVSSKVAKKTQKSKGAPAKKPGDGVPAAVKVSVSISLINLMILLH
jgi:GPI ethanolamine phosphate transferase 2/3 subunit F